MSKEEKLKSLEDKYDELRYKREELERDCRGLREDKEISEEDYNKIITDEEFGKEKLGDEYTDFLAKIKKIEELEKEGEKVEKEAAEAAQELYSELGEKISKLEEKIKYNEDMIAELKEEMIQLDKEKKELEDKLAQIEQSEEYKKGNRNDEYNEIKRKITRKEDEIGIKAKRILYEREIIDRCTTKIEEYKQKREELKEEYSTLVDGVVKDQTETENQPGKDDKEDKEDKDQNGNNHTKPKSGGTVAPTEGPEETPEEQEKREKEEAEKKLKKDFTEIYAKAKKGALTDKDFDTLVEIMNNPENYEKLGITTGVVFNKSKVLLKAMASKVGQTNSLSKESREKLGLAVEKPNKENGLMKTKEITDWQGIKKLINNPEQKIASEELVKKIVAMDRETLTDEQKEVYDKAKVQLDRFSALRGALAAYSDVCQKRNEQKSSWFKKKEEKVESLPPATKPRGKGPDFTDLTNPEPTQEEVDAARTGRKPRTKTKPTKNGPEHGAK